MTRSLRLRSSIARDGLRDRRRDRVSASFSITLAGLSVDSIGAYAEIGNEAAIGYSITPDNGTDTVAWDESNPNTGASFGTAANPSNLAALSGAVLFCHVADGAETRTAATAVRYAPGSAAGALADQNGWLQNTAITAVDPTGDFTMAGLTGTWSATGLPAGISINAGSGAITGTPTAPGSGSIVVTFTDQYGRTVSSAFSYTIAAADLAAPIISGGTPGDDATDVAITANPTVVFNENVQFAASGLIILYDVTGAANFETFDVTADIGAGPGKISISGNTLTIEPTNDFANGNDYAIRFSGNPIEDLAGNDLADVNDSTTYNFSTVAGVQIVITSGPTFNGTDTISMSVNRAGTIYWMINGSPSATAAAVIAGTGAIDSDSFPVNSGSNNGNIAYPNVPAGNYYLHIVADAATSPSPSAVDSTQYTFPSGDVTAPTLSSATDAANGQTASTGSVSTNEDNGTLYWVVTTSGTSPSAAQVKAGQDNTGTAADGDSGSQAVSATGVQNITPSGLTASTNYTTHFMHEDAAGNQSAVASASGFTTSAAATVPAAMVDANWSVVTGSNPGEIDFTVASAPSNGGSAITKYQYTTDGGTNWRDSGLTAPGTVALSLQSDGSAMANGTNYDFEVRAVNAVGNAPASNIESATSGAAAGNPELLPGSGFDDGGLWAPPGGVTIQNSAAEWDSAGAFSTLWTGASTANMAPVSPNTAYTWGVTAAARSGVTFAGGNFTCGVTWYTAAGAAISTDEGTVAINAPGDFTRALAVSPANAAFASWRAKPWQANRQFNMTTASIKAT
jgi:hypothetical protein